MHSVNLKNLYIQNTLKFIFCFVLYIITSIFLRFCSTESISLSEDWGYIATFAALFSLTLGLFSYKRRPALFCAYFILLYFLSATVKRWCGMILSEREIVHTVCFATCLISCLLMFLYAAASFSNRFLRILLKSLGGIFCVLALVPCLIMIGYFLVHHALFSSDIVLTFFQTNLNETLAYLSDQNLMLWGFVFFWICVFLFFSVFVFEKIQIIPPFKSLLFVLTSVVFAWCVVHITPKLNLNFVSNISFNTLETLKNFQAYEEQKLFMRERVKDLKKQIQTTSESGIYVLVIGESQTRDHMEVYGYRRPTTPWLSSMKNHDNTIVFENAYANHTHTVPTLSYALSSSNQYNHQAITDSFSIVELAKAANFETYWISNQPKDSVFLNPLSVISSTTDHQIWLNSNIGDKLSTEYYDERLADEISKIKPQKRALFIVHLMGSHGAYRDRYPLGFNRFEGGKKNVDLYDNTVLYTDFVLEKIFKAASNFADFKALVYLSDHGDDADNKLGHESARFTFAMARIPFVFIASPYFINTQHETFIRLKQNKDKVWTNDLLYDFMLETLNIHRKDEDDNIYALTSMKYPLSKETALTLHGQKQIRDE